MFCGKELRLSWQELECSHGRRAQRWLFTFWDSKVDLSLLFISLTAAVICWGDICLHAEHALCVEPHDPWGAPFCARGRILCNCVKDAHRCSDVRLEHQVNPRQEREKKRRVISHCTRCLNDWQHAASNQSAVRCTDRQLDAGREMASKRQHESSSRKIKSKQEEARASLDGGYVVEIKKKNFVA